MASDLTACLCRGWCLLLLIAKTFQGFVKGHPKEKPLEIKCSRREAPLPFHYAGMRYCGLHMDGMPVPGEDGAGREGWIIIC